jgi:hypothetical protein
MPEFALEGYSGTFDGRLAGCHVYLGRHERLIAQQCARMTGAVGFDNTFAGSPGLV